MKNNILTLLLTLFTTLSFAQEKASANIIVTDFEDIPIIGAQIQFFDTKNNTIIEGISNKEGNLILELPAGFYNIRLKSVGKSKDYSTIEIPTLGPREVYNDVNIIIKYAEESSFTLSDLHFETGKSTIKANSYSVLDELVDYMNRKSDLKIEIGGHTDNEGSETSNKTLSQSRAEAVRKYLIKKGISASRMVAKGYGEAKPIADNLTMAGRALNRRTEINIIE